MQLPPAVLDLISRFLPSSTYVSAELTHFAGRGRPESDQYDLLVSILKAGQLHGPNAAHMMNPYASLCANDMYVPRVVCFCDIPRRSLRVHMAKYSPFGLSFNKEFLIRQGANPVLYVAANSLVPVNAWPTSAPVAHAVQVVDPYAQVVPAPVNLNRCQYFDVMVKILHSALTIEMTVLAAQGLQVGNPYARLRDLNTFISMQLMAFVKFFDDTLPIEHLDNFYMEREWRVLGDVNFTLDDVAHVFVPRKYIGRIRHDLPDVAGSVLAV